MRQKNDFNFAITWETLLKKEATGGKKNYNSKDVIIIVLVVFLIGAVACLPWVWDYKLGLDLIKTNQAIAKLNDIDQKVQKLNTLKIQIQNLKTVIGLTDKNTHDPAPLLEKLRLLLPVGTTVKSFALQADNSLTIAVSIPTPVDVARLWTSLRDSGHFQNVDIQTISLIEKAQDFNLSLKVK
jgi:type IV pilus assembly protein PilN